MAPLKITHTEFQQQVLDLATAMGWQHLHVRRTRGRGGHWTTSTNRIGWPDLFLWNTHRGGFAGVELKVKPDLPTPDQLAVLAELAAAGARTCVVYPTDLDELRDLLASKTMGWTYTGPTRT